MRIRSIKPDFWRSEDVKRLPREVRLLFIGLWSYVDDNGVGIDDYRQIAADLGPLEDDPIEFREYVREGLATLSRDPLDISTVPLVARYTVSGKRYLYVTGWNHQRVDKPAKPRYPLPPEGWTSTNDEPPETLATPSRESPEILVPGTEEQRNSRNRGTEEKDLPDAERQAHPNPPSKRSIDRSTDVHFEAFWINYPRKEAKAAARKAWPAAARKLDPERLAKAARYWAGLWADAGTPRQFIPYPATWLNGERWNDDPPARAAPVAAAKPSTTDARVLAVLALKERYRDPPATPAQPPNGALLAIEAAP